MLHCFQPKYLPMVLNCFFTNKKAGMVNRGMIKPTGPLVKMAKKI